MPFFTHNSANLFYTTHGPVTTSSPPILLIHGWACDSHDWSYQIPFILSLNLHVIALDHRGHGRSSAPPNSNPSNYTMRTLADDVVALVAHLDVGPVILVAHSMSTIIASIIAVEHPDIVQAVVYVHPIYSGTPPALREMSETMQLQPQRTHELACAFWEQVMYTPRTPAWLKTWHLRRLLGTDAGALAGSIAGVVDVFDSVVGRGEAARRFMRKRKGPRLVVATNGIPGAEGWEAEIGVDEGKGERVEVLSEGTFSHVVEAELFNEILGTWLVERGFITK